MFAAILLALTVATPRADSCNRRSLPVHDSLVARARRLHPEAWADSSAGTRLVGLVLDRDCAVRLHAVRSQRGGSFTGDEALQLLFPNARLGPGEVSGLVLVNRDEPNAIIIVWTVQR